jgi:hypothetical protein
MGHDGQVVDGLICPAKCDPSAVVCGVIRPEIDLFSMNLAVFSSLAGF